VLSVGEGGVIVPVGRDLTMIPLSGHTAPMTAVAYSPDGRWLATSASDGAIFLRDAETGVRQTTLLGHAARVRRLRFTRDGQVLASASTDGTVRFWRLEAPEIVRTIRAHSSRVYSLDRATEDRRVVSAANDGFVRVWDVSEGRKTAEVEVGTELLAAKLSPNGRAVAVLRATGYTLYDATLERPRGGVTSLTGVKSLEFFDDARLLLGTETGDVVEWDLGTSREQRRWRAHEGAVESIERTSRGQIVTVTGGSAALWDPDGSLVRRFADATFLSASASSPDGSRILVFGLPRAPSIWTASDGRRLQTLEGHTSDVRAACYTTDGRLLVTTGMDETLRVWDGDEGTLLSTVTLPAEVGFSLAPGARPDEVLVGLLDGRILVWTLAPAEPKADVLGCKAPYAIGPDLRVSLRSACGGR
jgi:WD40 repeat protein